MRRRTVLAGLAAALASPAYSAEPLLRRVAGQLLLVGFAGTAPGQPGVEAVARQIAEGAISGVLLLDRNIEGPSQLARLTARLSREGKPFIAIDQEGGRVARLRPRKGFARWHSAREVARRHGADGAAGYYAPRARELARLGINLNLGPVVDLDLGAASPVIGRLGRAFSSDPAEVAATAQAFVEAHRVAGVATALKHFPGHGSARVDSHDSLPDVTATWHEEELAPFRDLARAGMIDMVMTAHLMHPAFSDAPGVPSSLSARTVNAIRTELGFGGVVITDDLQMGAVSALHDPAEAAIRALAAGSDLVILAASRTPDRLIGPAVGDAVVAAALDGRLSERALARSFLSVTALKERMGI